MCSRSPSAPKPTWEGVEGGYSSLHPLKTAQPSSRPYETSTTTLSMTGPPTGPLLKTNNSGLLTTFWASCPTSPITCVLCCCKARHGTGFCLLYASVFEFLWGSLRLGLEPTPLSPTFCVLCRRKARHGTSGSLVFCYCVVAWHGHSWPYGLMLTPLRGGTFDPTFYRD